MLLAAVVLQTFFIAASARGQHASRRSVPLMPPSMSMSKGGWRPVLSSGGFPGYSLLGAASGPAPKYKIPVPVASDSFSAASKPAPAREPGKLTSIAQSYRPTTLRSVPNLNAPVQSYLNPFSLPNSGLSHYKIVQNFPMENVVIRNPNAAYQAYQARPLYGKFPVQMSNKFKQAQLHNAMMQQLAANNFHLYPTTARNPHNIFSKPVEVYVRPTEAEKKPEAFGRPDPGNKPAETKHKQEAYRPDAHQLEVYKPEVYKVADSDGAPQSVNKQQVKTAQQTLAAGTLKPPSSAPYQHYNYKDDKFSPLPPSILGSFGTFGFQSVKARDPAIFGTKTTYLPPAPTKHTVFNSFSFTPALYNQDQFVTTTPKVKPSPNQIVYGNTFGGDFKNIQAQAVKQNVFKIESNVPPKGVSFKASPQDPFAKPSVQPLIISSQQPQINGFYNPFKFSQYPQQFSTYYTTVPTTTSASFNTNPVPNRFASQLNPPYTTFSTFYGQHSKPEYDQNKQTIQSISPTAAVQDENYQYSAIPTKDKHTDATPDTVPFRATYDVTETYEIQTQPQRGAWLNSPDAYSHDDQQPTQQTDQADNAGPHAADPTDLPQPELPTEYTFATEANENKQYDNSLAYETDTETQSRRPLGDDFEPHQHIGKHKIKDYYYRVTTPTYNSVEATTQYSDSEFEVTTRRNTYREPNVSQKDNSGQTEQLPTLPPNRHFRRPHPTLELTEKDKNRKKNKNRRRRPTPTPNPVEKDEVIEHTTTVLPIEVYTTEADGTVHTVRPRIRVPIYGKPKPTTPTVTTDLSTSALPTLSPTTPTVIRKKLPGRRTTTFSPNEEEYTTTSGKNSDNDGKGSSIMKIANRQPGQRTTTHSYDFNTSEKPDYSHKQDEKDTPTSDIAVNTSGEDVNKNFDSPDTYKPFDFHVNVKPLENKLEQYPTTQKLEAAHVDNKSRDENREIHKDPEPIATSTSKAELSQLPGKVQRPRLKNKYDNNRPRFSVKDYRNRMSSTTTTEKSQDSVIPKLRFPQRRLPVYNENKLQFDGDNTTETPKKKFTPKDPRHKSQEVDAPSVDTTTERHSFSTRSSIRHRPASHSTDGSTGEPVTAKISSRIRASSRNSPRGKTSTTEAPVEQAGQGTAHIKRPLRKKHKETDSLSEPSEDVAVTEVSVHREEATSERQRSESAIMKIAKDERKPAASGDAAEHSLSEHSRRVSDLTLAASKDYNTPGMFKTVSPNSRRIPNYFTIATDDPILPIEAFFPQLNQKKES